MCNHTLLEDLCTLNWTCCMLMPCIHNLFLEYLRTERVAVIVLLGAFIPSFQSIFAQDIFIIYPVPRYTLCTQILSVYSTVKERVWDQLQPNISIKLYSNSPCVHVSLVQLLLNTSTCSSGYAIRQYVFSCIYISILCMSTMFTYKLFLALSVFFTYVPTDRTSL